MTRRTVSGPWKVRTTSNESPRHAYLGPSTTSITGRVATPSDAPAAISWRSEVSPRNTPSGVAAHTRTPSVVIARPYRSSAPAFPSARFPLALATASSPSLLNSTVTTGNALSEGATVREIPDSLPTSSAKSWATPANCGGAPTSPEVSLNDPLPTVM